MDYKKKEIDGIVLDVFDKNISKWTSVDFFELSDGCIFRMFDCGHRYYNEETGDNVWVAIGVPYKNKDGIWTIKTLY